MPVYLTSNVKMAWVYAPEMFSMLFSIHTYITRCIENGFEINLLPGVGIPVLTCWWIAAPLLARSHTFVALNYLFTTDAFVVGSRYRMRLLGWPQRKWRRPKRILKKDRCCRLQCHQFFLSVHTNCYKTEYRALWTFLYITSLTLKKNRPVGRFDSSTESSSSPGNACPTIWTDV